MTPEENKNVVEVDLVKETGPASTLILSEENHNRFAAALDQYEIPKDSRDNLKAKQQRIFVASQMKIHDLKGNKRLPGEDFEEYRERRTIENLWTKMSMSGKMAWQSVDNQYEEISKGIGYWVNKGGGTYDKSKHGFLTEWDEKKSKKLAMRKLKNLAKNAVEATKA